MSQPASRGDWERVPQDPDGEDDLGYEMADWNTIEARRNGSEHLMFIPDDTEMLREEAFIVAHPNDVTDVVDHV